MARLTLVLLGICLGAEARFLARNATGNGSGNGTDLTVASDRHYEGFKDEWHKEWRRGDFPSWKETQTTAWMDNSYNRYQPKDYVDSQSDGKPSPALLQSCVSQDLKRRAQLQNKLASVCEDMCKEVGAYPKCSQCPNFVPPDATPGVMTWEELLTHMDNLVDWGRDSLKGWKKQATLVQLGRNATGNASNSTDLTIASDRHYEGFQDEWHKEWRRGDFPSWKETQTTAWMDNSYNRYQPKDYVDAQSDGKPSPAR